MSWTEDRDKELSEDWASGLTAGQILQKRKWPCTENAINMRARRRRLPPRVRVNGGLLPVVTMDDAPIPVVDPRTMFRDCLHCRTSFLSQHGRSEEHTSELQSLMRISYAVFCLKKK